MYCGCKNYGFKLFVNIIVYYSIFLLSQLSKTIEKIPKTKKFVIIFFNAQKIA